MKLKTSFHGLSTTVKIVHWV